MCLPVLRLVWRYRRINRNSVLFSFLGARAAGPPYQALEPNPLPEHHLARLPKPSVPVR